MNRFNQPFIYLLFLLSAVSLVSLNGCKGDDDAAPCDNCEEELITTVNLIFTPVSGGAALTFSFRDVDGDGGNAPTIDDIQLAANTNYQLTITAQDESKTPTEEITTEIQAEDDEHLFIFTTTTNLTITPTDMDGNGNPVGLTNTAVTGDAGMGTLKVVLKHQPDKSAADPSTTGETDVEADFNVTIQ